MDHTFRSLPSPYWLLHFCEIVLFALRNTDFGGTRLLNVLTGTLLANVMLDCVWSAILRLAIDA